MKDQSKINAHKLALRKAISELFSLQKELDIKEDRTSFHDYVFGAVNFALLEVIMMNECLISGNPIDFTSDEQFLEMMARVNRSVISDMHSTLETCVKLALEQVGVKVEASTNKRTFRTIAKKCDKSAEHCEFQKLVGKFSKPEPGFQDYVNIVMKGLVSKDEKEKLQILFDAFGIIRNRCAHSNKKLKESEIKVLGNSPFEFLVMGDQLQLNVSLYYPWLWQSCKICDLLVEYCKTAQNSS